MNQMDPYTWGEISFILNQSKNQKNKALNETQEALFWISQRSRKTNHLIKLN
jgi:hypothetical protein